MENISNREQKGLIIYLVVLLTVFLVIVGYFNVYIPMREGATWENRFEKIVITNVDAKRAERLVITLNYRNDGSYTNISNIFINKKPLNSYTTLIDLYDETGNSVKNLLGRKPGLFVPKGKEGKLVIAFMKDAFTSEQVLDIDIGTVAGIGLDYDKSSNYTSYSYLYSTSCKIP
jgi:uncharacterized membrane protein